MIFYGNINPKIKLHQDKIITLKIGDSVNKIKKGDLIGSKNNQAYKYTNTNYEFVGIALANGKYYEDIQIATLKVVEQ